MHNGAYLSRRFRLLLTLAALLLLPLALSANRLNLSYLTPSGQIAVDQSLIADTPLNICALTFDDGPDATYTRQVMEILDSYGVKGTFFVIGKRVQSHPEEVKALVRSGHEIGNHSFSHPDMSKLASDAQASQMQQTAGELAKLGIESRWFRPPYGEFNQATLDQADSLGMDTILWSADPKDWSQPGVKTITSRVLRQTGPGGVILLHSTNAQTVAALPGIITGLGLRGYTFTTLSQWRALVTGEIEPPQPGMLQYLPQAGGRLAIPHQPQDEPFYNPYSEDNQPKEILPPGDVPRVIEQLENRTPVDCSHLLWSCVNSHARTAAEHSSRPRLAALTTLQPLELPASPTLEADVQQQTPPAQLTVYANFAAAREIADVYNSGGQRRMQNFTIRRDTFTAKPAHQIETMQGAQDWVEIEDTEVLPAAELPVLPEGEVMILPPGEDVPLAPLAEVEAPAVEPAAASTQPLDLPHVPLTIIDLVDMEQPATVWSPPASLDASHFSPYQPPRSADGPIPEAEYYFLAMVGDLENYTWTELKTYIRLAKLSGLVLPGDRYFVAPSGDLPYPWTYSGPLGTDRSAWIDLTVEDIADVMEVLKRGKQQVFIVVRPSNLHFFIAAHAWAEMNTNMRDFVLFRQLTGGMELDPAPAIAADFNLPEGVELARFSDGVRESLVLYSQSYRPVDVLIPASCGHMSRAFIDAGGYLKIAPMLGDSVTVDRSPVILYYEHPAD